MTMRVSGECCFSCEVFTLNVPLKRSTFFFISGSVRAVGKELQVCARIKKLTWPEVKTLENFYKTKTKTKIVMVSFWT